MEQRITSLLVSSPEAGLEAACKELDGKVTWLLNNSRKMDNYLELEPFSKDGRLCGCVCHTLRSLPETPTLAAYKDYKAIIILRSTGCDRDGSTYATCTTPCATLFTYYEETRSRTTDCG